MTNSTTDVEHEPETTGIATQRNARRWAYVCAILVFLLLIVCGLYSSHYQPIVFAGGAGINHPSGTHVVDVTQEFLLRNIGPLGVTVVGITGEAPSGLSSQAHFASSQVCPLTTPRGGDCRQNATTGLLEGKRFHPFSLTTDNPRGVLMRYDYSCTSSNDSGMAQGTITLPVTIRFLWFTHTIQFTESADDSATCASK
jgi:hypothetical protein